MTERWLGMYEIRVEHTGELLSRYPTNKLSTARSALFCQGREGQTTVLLDPDGRVIASVSRPGDAKEMPAPRADPVVERHMPGDRLNERLERWHARMVRVGQRFGIRWLVYNPVEFYRWHVYARLTRRGFVAALLDVFPDARSFADVGSGTGTYAAELRRHGQKIASCEHSLFGRLFGRAQRVPTRRFDLAKAKPARIPVTDLAYCLEVAEHLPPELGDRLVDFLSGFPTVLFTAAHPGQSGFEHINEQPKAYWIERFAQRGMRVDEEVSERIAEAFRCHGAPWWLPTNAIVFRQSR